MIRALLCDFDGVIRFWHESDAAQIEHEFGFPPGILARAAFVPELLRRATTGVISDQEWRKCVAETLAVEHGGEAAAAVAAWCKLPGVVDEQMVDLLRWVRRVVPVVLLTNATTRLEHDLKVLGLDEAFDAVANSSALGVAKPEREVFERAAELVSVPLAECVVIDDQPANLDAARAAGASVIHHTTVAGTRDALAAFGLPL